MYYLLILTSGVAHAFTAVCVVLCCVVATVAQLGVVCMFSRLLVLVGVVTIVTPQCNAYAFGYNMMHH